MRSFIYLIFLLVSFFFQTACGKNESNSSDPAETGGFSDFDQQCSSFPTGFNCGGDPTGRWQIISHCPMPIAPERLLETCPDATVQGQGSGNGVLELKEDHTFNWYITPEVIETNISFPLACFGGSSASCSGTSWDGSCSSEQNICYCDIPTSKEIFEFGRWSQMAGPKFSLQPANENSLLIHTYCVTGNILRIYRQETENYSARVTVFSRIE